MRKYVLLSACLCACTWVYAQDDTTEKQMDEAIVYSNKFAEKKKNLAQKIDIITARIIARYNSQNAGDLLVNTGNIFVQKSQQGGSSPILRGFEASRVLIVVDGVRMNNAIYRAGHLQNVITVDQNMLERVEVLYGPASTIYGSDALGGVIHFRSKTPVLSGEKKFLSQGNAFTRYSSVNDEKTVHADLSLGWKNLAWLQSYTYSDFGDLKMGGNDTKRYPGFGRRTHYIETMNGSDLLRTNADDRVQRFTGYRQWDITQKLLISSNEKKSHALNFQYSGSSNIPRYDRLQDLRDFGGSVGTTLRYAEWFYGPQIRLMAAYEFNLQAAGFLDYLRVNLNYQDIKESRQQREYLRYDRFDSRREHVRVWGFNIDGRKLWGNNELNMGVDGQHNSVNSVADRTNLATGAVSPLDTRYPDGANQMNFIGIYFQHLKKMKSGKLVINDGIRLQVVNLHSTISDNSFFNLPVTDFKQTPFAVTGNIGLVFMPSSEWRVNGNLSTGFRAPNIDDVSRIFESSSADKRVIVPNTEIGPEYTYNGDLGITKQFKNFRIELSGFYTLFRDAISLAPHTLNGQDSIEYNGVISAVYANRNLSRAFITGFTTRIKIDLNEKISLDNNVSYTYGRYKRTDSPEVPMDHIPPVFGRSSFNYSSKKLQLEFFLMYNAWKRINDYNPDGEDNGQYATPEGTPSWYTINIRGQYVFHKHITLQLGLENILDRNYRYFASGLSAPGRNLVIALRGTL